MLKKEIQFPIFLQHVKWFIRNGEMSKHQPSCMKLIFAVVHNNITQLQEIVSTIFTFMECRDLIL